eukprot:scaffold260722_cov30-Prasinocladus_malaysianus.AAC.1
MHGPASVNVVQVQLTAASWQAAPAMAKEKLGGSRVPAKVCSVLPVRVVIWLQLSQDPLPRPETSRETLGVRQVCNTQSTHA